jgi:hypothetical protein
MHSLIHIIPDAPQNAATLAAVALAGAAAGFLVGYLRCRARSCECPAVPAMSFGNRVHTLLWSAIGGLLTSVGSHWAVSTGAADRFIQLIEWLISKGSVLLG